MHSGPCAVQATQDAQKWNKCMQAEVFALLHDIMTSDDERQKLGLNPASDLVKLFGQIALAGHFIFAIKMVTLGPGPVFHNKEFLSRPTWCAENIP